MITALKHAWAAALLLAPLAASAQSPAPGPAGSPAPAAAALAPAAPAPGDDAAFAWVGELFGAGDGDEFDLGGPPDGPLAAGGLAFEGEPGAGAGRGLQWEDDDGSRHVHRIVLGGPQGRRMMMRRGMAMRLAALDLTEAQKTRLRDLHEAAARKSVQRRADLQLARMDLHKLMRAESPSASAVNAQIDKLARLQSDGMKARFDTFMQARAVLTPEQLKKLRSPMEMREPPRHDGD